MMAALIRKAGQVLEDATLRRWLLARLWGRTPAPPSFVPHRPPYLASPDLGAAPKAGLRFPARRDETPSRPAMLDLAGLDVVLPAGGEAALFDRKFEDIEQRLALHRFAWIGEETDPVWVAAIWKHWMARFGKPDGSWPWHPYTAAERAVNLLAFAERHGLPEPCGESWNVLAAHAQAILDRLEYFGPHYTGNHLANNGRGLYRLGTALGWKQCADIGGRILLEEAARIFGPSGVLIEGSSHYHLLLARNYAQAAKWAEEAKRPEAAALQDIAGKTRYAAGGLLLTGGLPLIGDISPDLPPEKLVPEFERTEADLSADGWHRFERDDWSLLLYAPPDGWPPMPGHGHQDLGSFELHWRGVTLIVDPGRGHYGEDGEAAAYRSATVHNALTFMGRDPRPINRPYYAPSFRRRIGGPPPAVVRSAHGLELTYPMQGAMITRRFTADGNRFTVEDVVAGKGRRSIERGAVIHHPVRIEGGGAIVSTPVGAAKLTVDDAPWLSDSVTRWTRYGQGQPALRLKAPTTATLPWRGRIELEAA